MKLLRAVTWLSLWCGVVAVARGEVLPVRSYTTSDGLVSNFVQRIVRDSHGFLWFCARGGLSRFDGHTFKNYTTAEGLPNPTINDIIETRTGEYLIATNGGGGVRFDPSQPFKDKDGRPNFRIIRVGEVEQTNRVNRICEDRLRRIWVTTDGGLFRLEEANGQSLFRFVPFEPEAAPSDKYGSVNIAEDRAGDIWVGTTNFGSMEEALSHIGDDLPDVVLLDIGLPKMNGIEGARILRQRHSNLSIVALSVFDDDDRIFEMICAGACGYLLKKTPPARLLEGLRDAAAGGSPMSPEVAARVIKLFRAWRPPAKAEHNLTPHETRILKLLVEGHSYKTAAAELGSSVNTIAFHMRSIYRKL